MNNIEIMDIQAFLQLVIVLNIAKRDYLTLYRGIIKIKLFYHLDGVGCGYHEVGLIIYLFLLGRKRILNYM